MSEAIKMTYYLMTNDNTTEYDRIYGEYRASSSAIADELHAKYPFAIAHSWQDAQANPEIPKQCRAYSKELHARMQPVVENAKAQFTFQQMMGKRKAELISEGARFCERSGITEAHIYNIVVEEKIHIRVPQSWYLFKENNEWFFKMSKNTKTAHKVEVVE